MLKNIVTVILVISIFGVIFVRAGKNGGMSGGTQASMILSSGSSGLADVIRAAQGG